MIPFLWIVQNRPIHSDRECLMIAKGCREEGVGGSWVLIGGGFLFEANENVLELDSGNGCITLWLY